MGKIQLNLGQAEQLVTKIVNTLAPYCHRIEVAGSVRRKKPVVGDIEIVCIPRVEERVDLYGRVYDIRNLLDVCLNGLVAGGRLLNPTKNGAKFKQFGIPAVPGLQLDLFITTWECWGVIYAIRTGSAEFSHRLVTQRAAGGLLPDDLMVRDGRVWRNGIALPTPEERDVFELIGGRVPPELRSESILKEKQNA